MMTLSELWERVTRKNRRKVELHDIPDKPSRNMVALFRLITGHDCLGEHLYRIGVHDHPYRRLSGLKEAMNRKHLQCCKILHGTDFEIARYWHFRQFLK
ncbi:hypothetical protein CEXT_599571 [Caerostris extrusa]|uniref:Uncharacterized protein n=1 Tax=Caerostris extrusa TaxID=172846 RepID=A0AAV4Y1L3_CAEEX|nr:hypothetical protein CEXT_599571 [Caerostris extrusa]